MKKVIKKKKGKGKRDEGENTKLLVGMTILARGLGLCRVEL